jgi:predicted transcriptional regulator
MDQSILLNLEKRRKIYNYIKKHPGLHFREVSRVLKIPKTTMDYHLFYLKKHGLITEQTENGYLRYYASKDIGQINKKILNVLRQDVPRSVILYLLMYPNKSQAQILKFAKSWNDHPSKIGCHLNKHHTTISFHLKKLLKMDVIEAFQKGNEVKYGVKNPEKMYDILILFEKSLLVDANGRYLKWVDRYLGDDFADCLIDEFFEIFPNPYSV